MAKQTNRIADNIDIQIEILPVPFERLSSAEAAESSAAIRRRVIAARAIQQARFAGEPAFPISPIHMREAVNYRNLDRASWGATKTLPF